MKYYGNYGHLCFPPDRLPPRFSEQRPCHQPDQPQNAEVDVPKDVREEWDARPPGVPDGGVEHVEHAAEGAGQSHGHALRKVTPSMTNIRGAYNTTTG
jgi:hypothetical protein